MASSPTNPSPAPELIPHGSWHEIRVSVAAGRAIDDHTPVFPDLVGPLVVDLRAVLVVTSRLCAWLMRLARDRPPAAVVVVCAPQGQAVLRLLHLDAILRVVSEMPSTATLTGTP